MVLSWGAVGQQKLEKSSSFNAAEGPFLPWYTHYRPLPNRRRMACPSAKSDATVSNRGPIAFLVFPFILVLATTVSAAKARLPSSSHAALGPLEFPAFKLPYPEGEKVYWTGGPHPYGETGLGDTYQAGLGSGIDFSNGKAFEVLVMASGKVIEASCEGYGDLGCIVAVQHDAGRTVLVYAHLDEASTQEVRDEFLRTGEAGVDLWAAQGTGIGKAGNTYNQASTHLHVELRRGIQDEEGNWVCYFNCLPAMLGGNPVGWGDGIPLVDGYRIFSYIASLDDPIEAYNYDGSAVKGQVMAIDPGVFYFDDAGMSHTALVRTHVGFECRYPGDKNRNCELPQNHFQDPSQPTKFATSRRIYTFSQAAVTALASSTVQDGPGEVNVLVSTNTFAKLGNEGRSLLHEWWGVIKPEVESIWESQKQEVRQIIEAWFDDQFTNARRGLEDWIEQKGAEAMSQMAEELETLIETDCVGASAIMLLPSIYITFRRRRNRGCSVGRGKGKEPGEEEIDEH